MKPRHQVSEVAVALIKRFEGLRRTAAQLDDGRWTIGYGHTRSAREGATVTEDDAEALLLFDLIEPQAAINDLVFTPLTQNQFDALCAFVFNIGVDEFRHSAVLRRINEGALLQAACALEMWRKADFEGERIVVDALVRRRAAEKALFLTPPDGFVPAPTPLLKPRIDYAVGAAAPKVEPTDLGASLSGVSASLTRRGEAAADPQRPRTASERVAAAVTSRLRSILPDPPEVEPFPLATGSAEPEPITSNAETQAKVRSIFEETREAPERPSYTALIILTVVGFFVFGSGLFWAFKSNLSGGLIVTAGGILCLVTAVYFLLEKLGGER
jgi:lysozyme